MRADIQDLAERVEAAQRSEIRHYIYAILGVTPAALIPLLGLAMGGEGGLVALLIILVVAVENRNWLRARREAHRLERLLSEMQREAVGDIELPGRTDNRGPQPPVV